MGTEINDTIAAVGTRAGEAAIGIVKLSGNRSIFIADKLFRSKNKKKIKDIDTYSMLYGHIIDNKDQVIDEVIITIMKKPGSYTREDVVEINCHGGLIATTKTLELCVENGARIADPGEFTKRAFLNGRIDLSQAEAVIDLVRSRTEQSLKLAAKNLQGNIKEEIKRMRKHLLDIRVQLEASVDFIEEDLEVTPYQEITGEINKMKMELEDLILNEKKGEIIKNGVKIAIIGVDKSLKHIDEAELILLVLDGNRKLDQMDLQIISKIKGKTIICCINKIDLEQKLEIEKIKNYFNEKYITKISALKGKGIKELEKKVKSAILDGGDIVLEEKIIINSRHKKILEEVKKSLDRAEETQ